MEKEDPNWKKLEKIIAEIHKVLAPNAVVQHDEWVTGKSGATRKLDVSIRDRIGAVPILIVIDCKHHESENSLVDRKDVAGFAEQLKDVGADVGVMVTDTGYDSGAQYVAADNKILLKTYREAEVTDWENLVGKGAWFNFNHIHFNLREVRMILDNGQKLMGIPPNLVLYKRDGSYYHWIDGKPWTFINLFSHVWMQSERPREIGQDVYLEFDIDPPVSVIAAQEYHLLHINLIILKGSVIPKRYAVNIPMAKGKVLEDLSSSSSEYIQASTQDFNLVDIIESQEGAEYTQEEWEQCELQERKGIPIAVERDDITQIHLSGVRKDLKKD